MVRIHAALCVAAVTSLTSLLGAQAWAQTFVWAGLGREAGAKNLPKAVLRNGAIVERKGGEGLSPQSVVAWDFTRKQSLLVAANDSVQIEAAYPTARRAGAVVVRDICTGTKCRLHDVALVVPDKELVRIYRADSAQKISVSLSNGEVARATAKRVWMGYDSYGSDRYEDRELVKGAGFVTLKAMRKWLVLVGEHPEAFFDNKVLRKRLASIVSLEQFKELRQTMGVAGDGVLLDGRFVLLTGCRPHDCRGNYGAILIDTVTEDLWWTQYSQSGRSGSGGTTLLTERDRRTDRLRELLPPETRQADDEALTINEAGRLVYAAVPGRR